MHSIQKLLGSRVRQLRQEQGLKAADAAVLIGCDSSHYYSIERGAHWPSLDLLLAIAKTYKVDEADLFIWPGMGVRHDAREQVRLATPATLASLQATLPTVTPMPIPPERKRGRRRKPARSRSTSGSPAAPPRRRPRT